MKKLIFTVAALFMLASCSQQEVKSEAVVDSVVEEEVVESVAEEVESETTIEATDSEAVELEAVEDASEVDMSVESAVEKLEAAREL